MEINYDDYRVCAACGTVNLSSGELCVKCGQAGPFKTIQQAAGSRTYFGDIMVGIGIPASFVAPPTGIPLAALGFLVRAGESAMGARRKRREIKLRDEALLLFEQTLAAQTDSANQRACEGRQAFEAGDWTGAAEALNAACELGRTDTTTRHMLAAALFNQNKFLEAILILEELVDEGCSIPGVRELLASAYLGVGSASEECVKACLVAATTDEISEASRQRILRGLTWIMVVEGTVGPPAGMAIDLAKKSPTVTPELVASAARLMILNGDLRGAVDYCYRVPLWQHDAASLQAFATALDELGDRSRSAEKVFEASARANPRDPISRIGLAQAALGRRDHEEAERVCREGLEVDPQNVRLRYFLAVALLSAERYQESAAELQQILKLPGYGTFRQEADIRRLMATCFVKQGLLSAAHKQLTLADQSAATLEQYYELAMLFAKQGDLQSVKQCLENIYAADVSFRDVGDWLRRIAGRPNA